MKIKSARSFRQWYKTEYKKKKKEDSSYDENFIGTYYDIGEERINGFYELFHGDKPNIANDLMDGLKNAQDSQAIYEFIQNAADCDSDYFAVYYNDDYFLAINNGSSFTTNDLRSILNANQSTKTNNEGQAIDCNKIGRFGIGFKLVHRLVGENDGKNELVQEYKGPILFSWAKREDFESLLKINNLDEIEYTDDISSNFPSLFKILLTNFPTQPLEKIRDISFQNKCLFSENEFFDFIDFLKLTSQHFDLTKLSEGSLFFLKLGKGKSELLNDNLFSLDNGIANSLNFLNKLNKVELGFNNVIEKLPIKLISFEIKPEEIKNPEDEYCPAKIIFGYFPSYKDGLNNFKGSPNFYKYFPLSKETHGLNFILHSTAFRIKTDRTQFEEDTNSTNTSLFKIFWEKFKSELEKIKENNPQDFKDIYSNLLISKPLVDENANEKWFYNSFYQPLLDFLKCNIPTKNGFSANPENVKIKKIKQELNLSDFGLNHIDWFDWDEEEDQLLIHEAINHSKLGIKEWTIQDIIFNSEDEKINNWICNLDDENYLKFLNELFESKLRIDTRIKLINIKLFKFSDNNYYSLKEITGYDIRRFDGQTGNYLFKKTDESLSSYLFHSHKTENIEAELTKLGFYTCETKYSKFIKILFKDGFNVYYFENVLDELVIYLKISEKCKSNTLTPEEKKKVFLNFKNETTKFDKVGDETLKKLELFCDYKGEIKPLSKLVSSSFNTSSWLNSFKIKTIEYFAELNSYLIQEEDLFDKIILPNIEIIKDDLTEAKEIKELITFFKNKIRPFFNEYIILKQTNGFKIIDKSDKFQIVPPKDERKTFNEFIYKHLSKELIILPYEFTDFNDQDGILKGEKLHSQILTLIDVDVHKETLVDIIHYNDPKRKFLQNLTEFEFNSESTYTKEDYEFKILDLACDELKIDDFQKFRNSVRIKAGQRNFKLSEISMFADKIKISKKEFSLSKILPETYQNSNLVGDLITSFANQGIPNEKLNQLFGVHEDLDLNDIFKKFSEQIQTLANPDQFFFLIYYNQHIEKVDLSKLGFDLNCAVYPSEFALEKERLPEYLQNWITKNEINLSELQEIGVFTINSKLVSLRKFFLTKSEFNINAIAEKLSSNGTMLLNTFELMKEKGIEISNDNEFSVFKEIVRVINTSRAKGQELKIQDEYNFAILEEKSTKWQTVDNFEILLYKGALPKIVKLDEIQDYLFYQYNQTDFAVNGNIIYLNENSDRNKVLMEVATHLNDNNFTLSVFGGHTDETEILKQELEKLKQQLVQSNGVILGAVNSSDLSKNDQKEANREAKVIVKEKLESVGFEFTNGIEEFSTINGVIKEGIEYPLVVKSYKDQDEPLKIGANEWIQLMRPNSMFWVYFGNDKIACLKLNELLRKQDNLTISFSTENLDVENRLEKFAELLRYFGDVHFDFHSVKPSNYSTANVMSNYQFDERKTEEDLSGDNQDLL